MDIYKSSEQLKAIAKEKALGKYGTLIGANIIIFAIQLIISGATTISTTGSILLIIIYNLITLICNILLGLLVSGKAYLYMNLLYSQTVSTADIFFGLRQQPQKAVIIRSVFVLADFITSIPAELFLIRYQLYGSQNDLAALILSVAIGLLINIIVYLTYSQAFFILHDFPDRSAKEILATSRRLMKGNKLRLFYLNVTFIPLYIFGCITLFIPLLWVGVYRYATTCAFYQDLIQAAAGQQTE
jgi:uncharacterized membrane protein